MAVLQVVLPLAFVLGAVHVDVDSLSVRFVIHPVAFVYVSVNVSELAEPVSPIVLPVSFVTGAIGPDLLSIAITEAAHPLTRVLRPRRVRVCGTLLATGVRVERHVRNRLSLLDGREVATISTLGLREESHLHAS